MAATEEVSLRGYVEFTASLSRSFALVILTDPGGGDAVRDITLRCVAPSCQIR